MIQHPLPVHDLATCQFRSRGFERQRPLGPGLPAGAGALDPGLEALKADGLAGADVVGLVFIAAFAPDAGESPGGISQAHPPAAIANLAPDSDGYLWAKYDKFHESFCQDLTADEALVMAVTQKAPLASTFGDNVTAPAWKKKPCWYQISSEDRMISPENQKKMSARMNPRKIITLAASHASLASRPGEVSALIDEAATELTNH